MFSRFFFSIFDSYVKAYLLFGGLQVAIFIRNERLLSALLVVTLGDSDIQFYVKTKIFFCCCKDFKAKNFSSIQSFNNVIKPSLL